MSATDPRAELVSLLPRLRRFAFGLTGDAHVADDLVQAGCLKAIERWHQWQPDTSLASWMFRILQTTWVDDYRSRQRQQQRECTRTATQRGGAAAGREEGHGDIHRCFGLEDCGAWMGDTSGT